MSAPRLRMYSAPPSQVVLALNHLRDKTGIPTEFSDEAQHEADLAASHWHSSGVERFIAEGARDARDIPFVTIDPHGSRDLDQAVACVRLDGDDDDDDERGESRAGRAAYRVYYAIASLATFVWPDGALDHAVRERGSTVYAPDEVTPLHPDVLCHDAASLIPDADRPSCLWTIDLDDDGNVVKANVERAVIRSRAQLDYDGVQRAVDGKGDLPDVVPADFIDNLAHVGQAREQREIERGGISMNAPEQEIEERDDGQFELTYRATLPVEEWNAQISLLTGMCAADMMRRAGIGILRVMPPATDRDITRLRRVAEALDLEWPVEQTYPDFVRSLDSAEPAHAAFMSQARTLFRGAGYTAFDRGAPTGDEAIHGAIAAPYAHVTAPLRRLVDRYGEEVCLSICAGVDVPTWVRDRLPELPTIMAQTTQKVRTVENGAVAALEAMVLAGHEGELFDAVVTSVNKERAEIIVSDPAVISRVDIQGIEDAPSLAGKRVQVRLEKVDPAAPSVEFALVADGSEADRR